MFLITHYVEGKLYMILNGMLVWYLYIIHASHLKKTADILHVIWHDYGNVFVIIPFLYIVVVSDNSDISLQMQFV